MSAPVSHTLTRTLGEAANAAARLVDACVDHAIAELQQAESRAIGEQRQQLADGWRELIVRRRGWSERFPRLLGAAVQADASGTPRGDAVPTPSAFAALSLVDDSEIARKIDSSRLAQQLTSMLERPLAELDALMSTALGLEGIQPERNPLRPAVYAQVLREMMGEDDVDPAWPGLWLRTMVKPMARELEQVYRRQAELLTGARVQAAGYRVVPPAGRSGGPDSRGAPLQPMGTPDSRGAPLHPMGGPAPAHGYASHPAQAGHAPQGGPPGHAPQGWHPGLAQHASAAHSGFADLPPQALGGEQLQDYLARGEPQAHRPLAPAYYAQAQAELRALQAAGEASPAYDERAAQQHMHLPAVERPPRHVDTDSPLPAQVWGAYGDSRQRALVRGQLKAQAREAGQVIGLEVVRRLVNKVAEDPRLLGPVREAIVGLEPSLSRLAMVAPRFFSDEAHPGRLLVERVADRSFKFNDEFSVEFQGFLNPVVQGFARLNAIEAFANAAPFEATLATLQAGWAAQDALDEEGQRQVLAAVQFAEQRQHEAERIAADLRQREDLAAAPQAVQDFLLGTWALVMANARLARPSEGIDPGGHLSVVTDLLWSVDRDQTLRDPARAFELIPRVLLKLRNGLESLGQQFGESGSFFQQLELLHRPVLKLRARQRHRELAPVAQVVVGTPEERPSEQPWMAPEELRAAGFEDTVPSDFGQLAPAVRPTQRPLPPLEEHEAEDVVAAMAPGSWIDLYSHQHWRRARLVWTSNKGTLFMFTSHGGRPHSMTRRSLQRLVRERLVRAVDADAVVPRALARLAQPAPPMPLAA